MAHLIKKRMVVHSALRCRNVRGRIFIFVDNNSKELCKKALEIIKYNGGEIYSIFNVSNDESLLNVLGSKNIDWTGFPQFFLNEVYLGGMKELITLHDNEYLRELIRETSEIDEDEKKQLFEAYALKKRLIVVNPDEIMFQISCEKQRLTNTLVLSNCSSSNITFRIRRINYSSAVERETRFLIEPSIGFIEPQRETRMKKNRKMRIGEESKLLKEEALRINDTSGMQMIVFSLKSSSNLNIVSQVFKKEVFVIESRKIKRKDMNRFLEIDDEGDRNKKISKFIEHGKSNHEAYFKVGYHEESF